MPKERSEQFGAAVAIRAFGLWVATYHCVVIIHVYWLYKSGPLNLVFRAITEMNIIKFISFKVSSDLAQVLARTTLCSGYATCDNDGLLYLIIHEYPNK